MDSLRRIGGVRFFFIFGDLLNLSVDLYYLIYLESFNFLFCLYQEDKFKDQRMGFQEIALERPAWSNLWSLDGAECIINAGDR
jgi:hypothetical protein